MTKKEAEKWYESLPDEVRMRLQKDFVNIDGPDSESKFYSLLKTFTKTKQKEYLLNKIV